MRISLMTGDDCCSKGVCNNDISNNATAELRTKNKKSIYEFFGHVKSLYAAALGIEILCIAAAEIGENTFGSTYQHSNLFYIYDNLLFLNCHTFSF
jgi:hypothetical protein